MGTGEIWFVAQTLVDEQAYGRRWRGMNYATGTATGTVASGTQDIPAGERTKGVTNAESPRRQQHPRLLVKVNIRDTSKKIEDSFLKFSFQTLTLTENGRSTNSKLHINSKGFKANEQPMKAELTLQEV